MKSVDEIKTVAGIGGGVIGGSWAVLFAMKGYDVNLYDINDDCIANDAKTIESNLDFLAQTGAIADKEAVKAHIHYTTSMEEAVKDAKFIQESGPERLPIKQSMLASIEEFAPVDAIIATSASGLPLGQITEKAVHPERCVGGHPYNPPHLIPLVEITKTEKTDMANVELAKEFYQKLGKELMSQDELAVMNGGKCILQLRGVRPFLSDKYDITKHPNYRYLSDADPKNAFDIEKFLSTKLKLKPEEEFEVFDAGAAAGSESA